MNHLKLKKAISLIDEKNSEDPNVDYFEGKAYPKEVLYSMRMTEKLLDFDKDASEELQVAVRAQHICRWNIARNEFPMDRVGYLKWREKLKRMHAKITSNILKEVVYNSEFINRVSFLIQKKMIKKDEESQTIEDVICLVFLQFYFEAFADKHSEDKVIDILQKTWSKMSEKGQNEALKLPLSDKSLILVSKALKK